MKHFMLRSLMLLSLLCSTWGVGSVWAQLENGKVYCFENLGNEGKSLVITNSTNLTIATTNTDDFKQQWFVEKIGDNVFTLRNLSNGKYLKSPNVTSNNDWTTVETVDDNCKFNCVEAGEGYSLRATNTSDGYHYMHYGSGTDDIVCWTITGATASHWRITEKTYEAEELEKRLDIVNSLLSTNIEKYKTALSNLFSDAACTTKKKSLTAEQLDTDEDYLVLSSTLQKMAKKVYSTANDAWTESNFDNTKSAWGNDYAKKYRVQWYEPYTEPECAASALRINAHTNLNNPTGIFANSGDVLFVMVEGEIKEGAYLYLSSYTGHGKLGGYRDGTELHTGLNVIPVTADGTNYCINYVVKTFDTTNGTGKNAIIGGRELYKYPDLQIHIEGGYINGYWNKMGDANHDGDFNYPADTDADWDYIKERATQTDVTVLGEYVTLQFPLTDAGTGDDQGMGTFFNSYGGKTTSLEASIEEWDNVMIWERLLMGVVGQSTIDAEDKSSPYSERPTVTAYTGDDGDDFGCDYSEYYRIHGLSFGTEGGYMYGGWDHCGYNFNTMESIMLSIVDEAGPHWGPAHEIGHQHQGPLNMRGLTEVTNNLFSNVVLWYFGKSTSRYNGTDGSLSNVLQQFNADGTDFFSNNIWAQTIMYYKLFLYYHVLGNNPKFYPRLFEMLRQNPMAIEYNQDGGKCLMHFYKLCCDAAGEDLTEFFRAHGFFNVMEDRFVGDYSNAVYNMTQAQIDAAIAEVEAKDYPENIAVLFITDATGEGNIESHRDDVGYLTHFDTNDSGNLISGELGNYATFNTVAAPSYNYTISGNSVTMEGTGGVGFAILNEKGELIGFSDKTTFELSDETMEALSNGDAQIVVMPAKGEPVEATAAMSESEIKRTLLVELIAQAEALDALTDDTDGKKIGFYKSSYMTDLNNALTKAQEVVENNTASAYTPVFNALKAAIDDLKSKEFAKITMKPGTYTVRNFAYTTRYLSVNGSSEVVTSTNAEPTNTEKWVFEQGDGNNVYYIKNLSTNKYVNALAQSTVVSATTSEIADAKGWLVEDLGDGVFGITCQDENNQAMHSAANAGYKIVGWNTGAEASRWYLTALETEQLSAEQQALEELIALSEDMLERVANVETVKERVELNENSYYCNAPHKSGGDKLTTYAVLYDNDYTTFLHTDYSGADSEDKLDHYLRVDLGDGNSASLFTFNYASRNSSNQNPTAITVEGCNEENGTYELITTLTRDADKLISGGNSEYHSAVMGLSSKSYRYLRFTVTGTIQGSTSGPSDNTETPDVNEENKHVFFVFSEFGVSKATCNVTALPKYSTLTNDDVTAAFNAIREAKFAYANATEASDYTTAYEALETYYEKLVDAYDTGDQTVLSAKKEELQTLIDNTTALIGECGEVNYTPAMFNGEAPLQANDANGKFYLSTNAQSNQEGPISGLIDGVVGNANSSTYFHTDYSGENSTDGLDHYIQVKLGEKVNAFKFTYTNRYNTDKNYATKMTIWGSTDGITFEEITRIEGLPASASAVYTSEPINVTKEYTHLRFMVTESDNIEKKGGHHFFHMAEFDLTLIGGSETYTAQLNQNIGDVTDDLLIAAYKENAEAQSAHTYATTEAQVDEAIAELQAQYDALEAAKSVVDKSGLASLIETTTARLNECGTVTPNGDVLEVTLNESNAGSVNKDMLRELYRAIEKAQGVIDDSNATQDGVNAEIDALTAKVEVVETAQRSPAKADLKTAIDAAQTAIDACASSITKDGDEYTVVWKSETAGDVDKATLIAAYEALVRANEIYNGNASTVSEYEAAKEALSTPITTLNDYKDGLHKSQLKSMVDLLTALIEKCNTEGQGDLTTGMLEEMVQLNETATAYLTQEFATQEVLVSAINGVISNIETNYPTWNAAQQSTAKQDLLAKIEQLQNLIDDCRANGTKIITTDVPCALQTSDGADFYISTNATATEGDIRNLVDGKMNTSFQTKNSVGAEHYLLVDAGEGNALEKFKFSYRTNKSLFPYTIKVYGSNNEDEFTEVLATFSKDDAQNPLPTSADQLWTSSEIGNGTTAYRFLRFNITKSLVGLKIDDENELDTSNGGQLSNKYKNSTFSETPASEYCFAMSEFDLIRRVDNEGVQLTEAEQAIDDANDLVTNSADADALRKMKGELETLYTNLSEPLRAASQRIQVSLTTTDANRDVLLSNIEYGQTIGTFSAPYATVIPEGVTAYYATQEYEGETVSLTPIEEGMALPANEGVILIGEVGVNSVMFIPATDETPANLSANTFYNSATSPEVMKSNDYILANPNGGQGIGFYKAKEGSTLKQGKAFFRLPANQAANSLILRFGGNTTDIDCTLTDALSTDDVIYDIYGRRVTEVKKGGIYIKNGKKFLIK